MNLINLYFINSIIVLIAIVSSVLYLGQIINSRKFALAIFVCVFFLKIFEIK